MADNLSKKNVSLPAVPAIQKQKAIVQKIDIGDGIDFKDTGGSFQTNLSKSKSSSRPLAEITGTVNKVAKRIHIHLDYDLNSQTGANLDNAGVAADDAHEKYWPKGVLKVWMENLLNKRLAGWQERGNWNNVAPKHAPIAWPKEKKKEANLFDKGSNTNYKTRFTVFTSKSAGELNKYISKEDITGIGELEIKASGTKNERWVEITWTNELMFDEHKNEAKAKFTTLTTGDWVKV